MLKALILILLMFSMSWGTMAIENYTPTQKKGLGFEIAKALRCPTSINQNLFDSQANIASELKAHIFRLLDEGKTKAEIMDYFTERYGEKIRYSPSLSSGTALLWFAPLLLLIITIGGMILVFRRAKNDALQE